MKTCTKCGLEKADFPKGKHWCRDCTRSYAKAYYARNREKLSAATNRRYRDNDGYRDQIRRRLYNMSPEEYAAQFEKQGGLCGICHKRRTLVVDHDHNTGEWRGLLCSPCNRSIGQLGDNLESLKAAVRYLEGQ